MHSPQEFSLQTAETLQQRILELASLMSRAAESLHQGEPVELQYLADEIHSVQTTVQSLSSQLEEHPLLCESERYVTRVNDIIESCKLISRRQQAIDQLKRLHLVKSLDPNDQEAFSQLRERLENTSQNLTSGTLEQRQRAMEDVLSEQSPIRAIYELIHRPEELLDDRWQEAQRLITDSFGSRVALAIIRGRAR